MSFELNFVTYVTKCACEFALIRVHSDSSKLKIGGGTWPSYLGVPAFHSADKSALSVDRRELFHFSILPLFDLTSCAFVQSTLVAV